MERQTEHPQRHPQQCTTPTLSHEYSVLYYKRSTRVHRGKKGVKKYDGVLQVIGPPAAKVILRGEDGTIISSSIHWEVAKRIENDRTLSEDEVIEMSQWEVCILSRLENSQDSRQRQTQEKPLGCLKSSQTKEKQRNCVGGDVVTKPSLQSNRMAATGRSFKVVKKKVEKLLKPVQKTAASGGQMLNSKKRTLLGVTTTKIKKQNVEDGSSVGDDCDSMNASSCRRLHHRNSFLKKKTKHLNTPFQDVQVGGQPTQKSIVARIEKRTKAKIGSSLSQNAGTKGSKSQKMCPGVDENFMIPSSISSILKPHQREGVGFLWKCLTGAVKARALDYSFGSGELCDDDKDEYRCTGAILADEMGLGKTLMTIAIIMALFRKTRENRFIVLCPSSLVSNWSKEFDKWCGKASHPKRIPIKKGGEIARSAIRAFIPIKSQQSEVLIVSFDMFRLHSDILCKAQNIGLLVIDEGHRLKNSSGSQLLNALNSISTKARLLITGTPIQNNLAEFYSIADWVNPGILGTLSLFKKYYERPISTAKQKGADRGDKRISIERTKLLENVTSKFVLRRLQKEVLTEMLMPRHEFLIFCKPSELQASMYRDLSTEYKCGQLDQTLILPLLTKVRLVCTHPLLVNSDQKYLINGSDSGKFDFLLRLLSNVHDRSEKIVIVSNFTSVLDSIEMLLLSAKAMGHDWPFIRLDGKTKSSDRQSLVDRFNNLGVKHSFVFLLSSKAGGCGLNLIGANRLVMMEPDWNPSVDLQAMARIYRPGQTRTVYIYRLFTSGTIDEVILQRQAVKRNLSTAIHNEALNGSVFSSEELRDCFTVKLNCRCDTNKKLGDKWGAYIGVETLLANKCDDDVLIKIEKEDGSPITFLHEVIDTSFAFEYQEGVHGSPAESLTVKKPRFDDYSSDSEFEFE